MEHLALTEIGMNLLFVLIRFIFNQIVFMKRQRRPSIEKNDMESAINEYNAAMKMIPGNLEMQYWTAITLANNKKVEKTLPMLKKTFIKDNNWKELTRRLPSVNLLMVSDADLKKILAL